MKSLVSILCLLGLSLSQDYPEVSKQGKDIKFLLQVTAPGASTPEMLFNKTKDPKDEPKLTNYLSPLGQRQQFLVGTEYRLRYVDEQNGQLLNTSYDISQIWIQSTFDQKTILSAQAQLIGLYPPQTYNNFLNKWQQGNAVPPLNNTNNQTWAHWQAELGSMAVLGGFNVYPINMVGADQDLLLNLNTQNCPYFNDSIKAGNGLDFDKYASFLVRLTNIFEERVMFDLPQGYAACQYLFWADLHSIELTVQYTEDDLKHCGQIMNDAANIYVQTNAKLNGIASNEFLSKVHDYISTHIGEQKYSDSKHFKQLAEIVWKNEHRELTASESTNDSINPKYVFYATSDINLQMFIATLVGKENWKKYPMLQEHIIASSSFILEIYEQDGKMNVDAYLNDVKIPLAACGDAPICQASVLTQWLTDNKHYKNDDAVAKACAQSPSATSFTQ